MYVYILIMSLTPEVLCEFYLCSVESVNPSDIHLYIPVKIHMN